MTDLRLLLPAGVGRSLLSALAVLAGLLAGCGGGTAASAAPVATSTVDLPASYRFAPVAITVVVGTTVTWTNHDNFTHNVAVGGTEALTMAPGESVTHTFGTAGAFDYLCTLHPRDMRGSVLVTDS